MSAVNINHNNFQNQVMDTDRKVLLDFWAPWCGPCKMVSPIIDEIAKERPDIVVGTVNVDNEMELARQFRAYSIPTLVVMENGNILQRSVGAKSKEDILAML